MRMILLSALFTIGVGLAGATTASAATSVPTMIDKAANSTSIRRESLLSGMEALLVAAWASLLRGASPLLVI